MEVSQFHPLLLYLFFYQRMAESCAVAKQAIKKLEDQLTCAICLDDLKDPKMLQCFHVYCKDCLQRLVVQDQQGQLSLSCPTCRQSTVLPQATGVSGLQSAFHVHHLLEIKDALEKVKEPQKVKCDKCKTPKPATSYCRVCGEFICATCTTVHREWDAFAKHEVIAMEQFENKVKQLDALKKVTIYCSLHQGKELEIYCETCEELICHNCTVSKHCRPEHKYVLVSDAFEKHKAEITASLEPINKLHTTTSDALEQLNVRLHEFDDQEVAVEASVRRYVKQLHELLETKQAEEIDRLKQVMRVKRKNVAAQKEELETVLTGLDSCLSYVKDSLRTGSQGEVIKIKKTMIEQIKEVKDNFKPDIRPPCEDANVKFKPSKEVLQACQKIGRVFVQGACPEKCHASGKGLEVAMSGERATAVLQVVDHQGKAYTKCKETPMCELVSVTTGEKKECSVKKTGDSQYEISYHPASRGRHQLHIKVEGDYIKGSPFPVTVKLPVEKLGNPVDTIGGVNSPWGVAVSQRGEVIVAESNGHCVSIFSPAREKLRSFGCRGSGHGQFSNPRGVAVDDDGNILVVDRENGRIQQFTSDGKFITAVGKRGNKPLEFSNPVGIAINPLNKKVYVADNGNHRIQILNRDFTFSSRFGSRGGYNGQFWNPLDVAFDSTGNVYVADYNNHRIQVLTAEGGYLRQFGKKGSGNGELNYPSAIIIDTDNLVYVTEYSNRRVSVFTCEGKFLTTFGSKGSGPGQFNGPRGVAVDNNGIVLVADSENNRLQYF